MKLFHRSIHVRPRFYSSLFVSLLMAASACSTTASVGSSPVGKKHADKTVDVRKLTQRWTYPLYAPVSATPVVVGEQLWVAAENGNLYAFDVKARRLQWLYHTEAAIVSTPVVADGRVHFLSRDGFVYALEQHSGKLLWRFATGGEQRFAAIGGYGYPASAGPVPDPWDFYGSSPLVIDGTLYVGSSDHHVYALDAATGDQRWRFNTGAPVHSSPVYAGGNILIGNWETKLYALDAQTGSERWQFQGGTDPQYSAMQGFTASPRVDSQRVYIGARDGFFYALRLTDGSLAWKYDAASSWVLSSAAIDDKQVYLGTSDTGLFLALDKKTGQEKYRKNTRLWTYASPVIAENRYVFAATMAGEIYAYDKNTGQEQWYYQTVEGRRDINDIVDNHTGKLRSEKLFAPDVQMQAAVEQVKALGAFVASPIWVNQQLIAVSANGNIVLFDTGHRKGAD
ncbi:outer membrane protein assembly factor BamB family protein [Cellvibrio japonicus]|uniref:Serine/threonine protein kinase n=1 Tax=Cellvibrio japonicus (strain Ueda107) TaxID=498211 RepID=B3PJR6_CELJU|nr:PQQ-binding-like beta-propeller repeat protein [Cellvibrio japonicus]ACE82763.1 serine/threonine protein kinase [Cellvibrio japonicus Ueda107]QEI12703.1 PQQ-like beta-propeller repeat protein [Cellvibrio japonicus]QEI16277.1 PQQ-like beta-propeller repeat protein [Cellvibrio japonicus]QEI19855.1 PQQ-like beta-propeller repeat protein [Cellvibrio japonicus]